MTPSPLRPIPTRGDMQAAFGRLLDGPLGRPSQRLCDALIVRDWLSYAVQALECAADSSDRSACPSTWATWAKVLTDPRPTSGRSDP